MRWSIRLVAVAVTALAVAGLGPAGRAQESLPGKICYTRKDGDRYLLHVMNADGKNDRVLPNQPGKIQFGAAWSPDGKQIAFTSTDAESGDPNMKLYVTGVDGTGLRRIGEGEKIAAFPAWSPDGKTILYSVDRNNKPQLMAVQADGTNARELRTGVPFSVMGFFSPDGREIVFTGTRQEEERQSDLYRARPDGSEAQKLTMGLDGFGLGGPHAWSPDGKMLAFAVVKPQQNSGELHTWLVKDGVDSRIAELKVGSGSFFKAMVGPSWSPDGKWLVIAQATENGRSAILRISADGKVQERITPTDADCSSPAWSR